MKTLIFVEQRSDALSKVQSSTFAVLYQLEDVDPGRLSLALIIDCAKMAPELEFYQHVKPTFAQLDSALFQMQVTTAVIEKAVKTLHREWVDINIRTMDARFEMVKLELDEMAKRLQRTLQ
jgi:hypothetical protein